MKTRLKISITLFLSAFVILFSCKKEGRQDTQEVKKDISQDVLDKVKQLGFSTKNVVAYEDGYLVEGDIMLSKDELDQVSETQALRVGEVEQYRTTNRVRNLPRTIKLKISGFGSAYVQGVDKAIERYNALNLRVTFRRITSGTADITISAFNEGPSGGFIVFGSSGFPKSSGDPYNKIKLNTHPLAYGSNPNVNFIGSVIQHEIGHCIGFRHTDYMNRSYSCGGDYINEGAGTTGAVHIPGTPTGPNANSWMLACINNGQNRSFNSNDKIALRYLY